MGLEEGAEVAAHEMGHAYVQHAPVKRASHVQSYVQVLLHGGNTAGLAYSIMICHVLACPGLAWLAILCCADRCRTVQTVLHQRANKDSNRRREDGTGNLTAIGRPGSGGSGDDWGRRTDNVQPASTKGDKVLSMSGPEWSGCCRCSSPVVRCGRLHELGVAVRTVYCVLFL